ncbi:MAG: flagellar type III secretion system pore protein FliP [Gammaproteobacteria bacterium]
MSGWSRLTALLLFFMMAPTAMAEIGLPALSMTPGPNGGETWSLNLQILAVMTALTLLPAALLMLTAFTRIIIVLALLRQALGTMQTPSNQILVGLALFLTFFVMAPVFDKMYTQALAPYVEEKLSFEQAVKAAEPPLRAFMTAQTRETDLALFAQLAGRNGFNSPDDVPFSVLAPAFVTSELKTAFQIGFLLFIPFLIIDLVVASVLMAMGMMMLSPMVISFPFKLMLFVLVDGWALVMSTLAGSFNV